ncbi:hypothetical protein [Microbacterium sp. H1-D42]|uniref:hypothetical protein n=1 Tax=Microbacterium sp. H1-D42 TaxID=2925844 RepID=UPI001F53CABF|nr:hypothetical protein [Microbacterium sp. H1-D42]UNK69626.1 hypothetical protein MNR00_10600 [Microbacterium sp. H1-D42]
MRNNGATTVEIATWTAFITAALAYAISGIVFVLTEQQDGGVAAVAAGWMAVSQWLAAALLIPAILLSGFRALLPRA